MKGLVERADQQEAASEPAVSERRGERWAARGWGKRRRTRRKRAARRGADGGCNMIPLTHVLFTCSCLDGDHVVSSAAARHVTGALVDGTHDAGGIIRGRVRRMRGRFVSDNWRRIRGGGRDGWYSRTRNCRPRSWYRRRLRPRAGHDLFACANRLCCVCPWSLAHPYRIPRKKFLRGGRRGGLGCGKTVSSQSFSERLLARRMELTRVSASSPATPPEPDNTPQEHGLFGSWLEVHFRDLYSTDEKRNLVAELLVDGSRRGEFQPLLGWTFSDPPPGRVAGIPVRGCRVDASRWTSPRGTGVDAVKLHLSQSPGTQRVG